MSRFLRRMAAWIRVYRVGLLVGVFLLTASVNCGRIQGRIIAVSEKSGGAYGITECIWFCLKEAGFCTALLAASLHPFGCAMNAAMLCYRGYQLGCSLVCSIALESIVCRTILVLIMMVQVMLWLYGCCISSYTALQTGPITRREMPRKLLCLLGWMLIAVLLRCAAFYMIR